MKKILTFIGFSFMVLFSSCRKTDNDKIPTLTRVPVPTFTKNVLGGSTGGDPIISAVSQTAAAAFKGVFTLALAFPEDIKPLKMDVVVIKNGVASSVKVVLPNVTTFPLTITVTGTQLINLFGPIVLGDKFDFGADVYIQTGEKFQAFPTVGSAYGSGVSAQYGGIATTISYSAICNFLPATFTGNFVVISDGWDDYAAGTVITLTNISPNQFAFKYAANNALPIICTVAADNSVTVAKQVYGNYGPPYGDFSCQTAPPAGDNFVLPCDGIFQVSLTHTVTQGSFGTYKIRCKKQ